MLKKVCLVSMILVLVSGCIAYALYKGDLVSETTEKVEVLSILPYYGRFSESPEIVVNDIKSNTNITMNLNWGISSFLSKGNLVDVTKRVYRKNNKLSVYYALVELDKDGRPIYDLDNAKSLVTTHVSATVLSTREVMHTVYNAHNNDHYYTYEITYKNKETSDVVTEDVSVWYYNSCYAGKELVINKNVYTLKNGVVVTNFKLT